jgi:hypothetical protein
VIYSYMSDPDVVERMKDESDLGPVPRFVFFPVDPASFILFRAKDDLFRSHAYGKIHRSHL